MNFSVTLLFRKAMFFSEGRDEGVENKWERRRDRSAVDMMAIVSKAGKNDKGSAESVVGSLGDTWCTR